MDSRWQGKRTPTHKKKPQTFIPSAAFMLEKQQEKALSLSKRLFQRCADALKNLLAVKRLDDVVLCAKEQ